jgi:hypothetical protein
MLSPGRGRRLRSLRISRPIFCKFLDFLTMMHSFFSWLVFRISLSYHPLTSPQKMQGIVVVFRPGPSQCQHARVQWPSCSMSLYVVSGSVSEAVIDGLIDVERQDLKLNYAMSIVIRVSGRFCTSHARSLVQLAALPSIGSTRLESCTSIY